MTQTKQAVFLQQQRAARREELEEHETEKREAARRTELQTADSFSKADLVELNDHLLNHLRPDKSIYFHLVLPWMRGQPQLSFVELPNLKRHLAQAYRLWRFEEFNAWWFWTHAFTFYCCNTLDTHMITIKATPI